MPSPPTTAIRATITLLVPVGAAPAPRRRTRVRWPAFIVARWRHRPSNARRLVLIIETDVPYVGCCGHATAPRLGAGRGAGSPCRELKFSREASVPGQWCVGPSSAPPLPLVSPGASSWPPRPGPPPFAPPWSSVAVGAGLTVGEPPPGPRLPPRLSSAAVVAAATPLAQLTDTLTSSATSLSNRMLTTDAGPKTGSSARNPAFGLQRSSVATLPEHR